MITSCHDPDQYRPLIDTPAAYWGAVHKKDMRSVFVVHHYAHTVRYHVGPVDVHKAHQQLLQESGGGSGAEGKPTGE